MVNSSTARAAEHGPSSDDNDQQKLRFMLNQTLYSLTAFDWDDTKKVDNLYNFLEVNFPKIDLQAHAKLTRDMRKPNET